MFAQPITLKKQVKALAKNLKKKFDVNESLVTLCQLGARAPLKYFEKYDVEILAEKYMKIQEYSENSEKLKNLLEKLKEQSKFDENKENSSSGIEKSNRKRQSSLSMEASSMKRSVPVGWEMFPTITSKATMPTNLEVNIETKSVGSKKAPLPNNSSFACDEAMLRRRTNASQMLARKRKSNEETVGGNEKLCRPAQILVKCNGFSYDQIKPVLLQCSSSQKLQFIKLNMNYAAVTEDIFQEMTKTDFKDIDALPSQYKHWFQYYEQLLEWKNNNEAMRLEEIRLMIAQKKAKQAENGSKTKIIEVQEKSPYRSSGGSIKRTIPLVQAVPIAQKAGKAKK